jgi:HD-GYP domain-containing protein (c-di-GMP phosphodiesterase class II)
VAVADVFTALTEDRPYRKGMTPEASRSLLRRMGESGSLDGGLVSIVLSGFDEFNAARARGQEDARSRYRAFWEQVGLAVS